MKLNETVANMLKHPIATTMIIGCVINGVVRLVAAIRGAEVKPNTVITIGKGTEPDKE